MARIRSIKPDFWKSETIAALSMQTRLTFIGLWSYVDDNGVGRDQERLIMAEIYPLEEDPRETLAHVHRSLDELADAGRVVRYTNKGRAYLRIANWDEHQKIDRPNKSRHPLPDDEGSTLTSNDAGLDPDPDEPSRDSRATPSTGVCSFGAGEFGAGEKNSSPPAAVGAPLALVTPDGATAIDGPDESFAEFWNHYPRKVGRADAKKAWARAHKRAAHKTILAGCIRLAIDPNLPEKTFIPHPATWLNRDGWEDEPLPVRHPASPAEAERHRRDRRWDETAARIDGNPPPRQIGGTA
jgi:hypothetical protein